MKTLDLGIHPPINIRQNGNTARGRLRRQDTHLQRQHLARLPTSLSPMQPPIKTSDGWQKKGLHKPCGKGLELRRRSLRRVGDVKLKSDACEVSVHAWFSAVVVASASLLPHKGADQGGRVTSAACDTRQLYDGSYPVPVYHHMKGIVAIIIFPWQTFKDIIGPEIMNL